MQPLALTMGDPAGIGGEITLAAWTALRSEGPSFAVLDDPARLRALGPRTPIREIATLTEVEAIFASALPILPVGLHAPVRVGRPDPANAPAVIASIETATRLALAGEASGVVTNPISKATLYDAGFCFPGHTEFLAALTGVSGRERMMLACPSLRVVPVTVHVALRAALECLTTEAIVAAGSTTSSALCTDFGIAAPRIAVAGLNPHAGEGGALGREEIEIIAPAIADLRREGIDASGPWPPDTMFTDLARRRYDVAICMYHDQALIPLKTLDVRSGVNVTLGLPIVRTSPDHGTAFDIAGTGQADPASLIAAIRLASRIAGRRAGLRPEPEPIPAF